MVLSSYLSLYSPKAGPETMVGLQIDYLGKDLRKQALDRWANDDKKGKKQSGVLMSRLLPWATGAQSSWNTQRKCLQCTPGLSYQETGRLGCLLNRIPTLVA